MSDYDLSRRLVALIGLLRSEEVYVQDVLDRLPGHYPGARDSAARKVRRDIGFLNELGFIVVEEKAAYMIFGYRFPEEAP